MRVKQREMSTRNIARNGIASFPPVVIQSRWRTVTGLAIRSWFCVVWYSVVRKENHGEVGEEVKSRI